MKINREKLQQEITRLHAVIGKHKLIKSVLPEDKRMAQTLSIALLTCKVTTLKEILKAVEDD